MSRLDEIKKRIENYKEEYLPFFENNGQMHEWAQMFEDTQFLINEVERHENMWRSLKSDAEIKKDWRLYRVCRVALREVE